ncbi:MAG: AI-2E family transporter [Gemmatimonadaceae bacterium]
MGETTERTLRFRRLTLPPPLFTAPNVKVDEAAAEGPPVEVPPVTASSVALVSLGVLAACVALYIARGLIMPIVIALLLSYLSRPIVRWFRRRGLREPIGAGFVVIGGLLAIVLVGGLLVEPANSWLQRAPAAIDQVARQIQRVGPVAQLEATAEKVERIAAGGGAAAATRPTAVSTPPPTRTPMLQRLFGPLTDFVAGTFSVIFLTYFLLASGDLFLRKVVRVMPQGTSRRMPREISAEIESSVSRYLFTVTLINIGLGLATWGVLQALGMPNAVLWGTMAGVLNLIPYLGAVVTALVILMAALVSFESVGHALLMPGAFLALNLIEANLVTPLLLGRHFPLNTVALFIGLMFWGFLWGIPGAILAVPMMVTLKIVCDRVPALRAFGEFLGS